MLAVERPRSAVDAAEPFTPHRPKPGNAQARRGRLQEESGSHGADARSANSQAANDRATNGRATNDGAASAQVLSFPGRGAGMATSGFVAQVLAQGLAQGLEGSSAQGSAAGSGPLFAGDGPGGSGANAAIGSEAYRRAGGEPTIYGEEPAYFRVAI